jgi:hypothetical protein
MCPKAIKDQYTGSPISMFLSLKVRYTLEPLQVNIRVDVSRLIARIPRSRSRKGSLVTSIGSSRLNDHKVQIPTISANTLHSSNYSLLYARASIVLFITLTYKDFCRAKHQ